MLWQSSLRLSGKRYNLLTLKRALIGKIPIHVSTVYSWLAPNRWCHTMVAVLGVLRRIVGPIREKILIFVAAVNYGDSGCIGKTGPAEGGQILLALLRR